MKDFFKVFFILFTIFQNSLADWESWWTYEGISGPDFWGRLNPKWSHCSKGARQSPIDIDTGQLLFDPTLGSIKLSGQHVTESNMPIKGHLINTGRGIAMSFATDKQLIVSDGPLSYQYTLANLTLHFGRENSRGSEHTINSRAFDGELQLLAYNSQLYTNFTEAIHEPNGLLAISVFIVLTRATSGNGATTSPLSSSNSAMKQLTGALKNITRRGQSVWIESLSVLELLPTLSQYVTYEGSLTQPACHETVQWILLNRPLHVTAYQFHMLRHSLKGDGHQDNFRPVQPLNRRVVRTNIVSSKIVEQQNNQNNNVKSEHPAAISSRMGQSSRSQSNSGEAALDLNSSIEQLMPSTIHELSNDVCDVRQLRLYGYKANRKMFEEL